MIDVLPQCDFMQTYPFVLAAGVLLVFVVLLPLLITILYRSEGLIDEPVDYVDSISKTLRPMASIVSVITALIIIDINYFLCIQGVTVRLLIGISNLLVLLIIFFNPDKPNTELNRKFTLVHKSLAAVLFFLILAISFILYAYEFPNTHAGIIFLLILESIVFVFLIGSSLYWTSYTSMLENIYIILFAILISLVPGNHTN